tara:strand:- start:935 stop:5848 length:4914 start_codon:yes stop_codon:yes gene_type:complete
MRLLTIIVVGLMLSPFFLPMAEAEITSTEVVVKSFDRNINESSAIPWDEVVNLGDLENATLNQDTWTNFLDDYPGNWVGGQTRETLISAPGGNDGNFTVAGASRFSPQEIMGGASEGWVRSPIATNTNSDMSMSIYHVENPALATLVAGEVVGENAENTTWTTKGDFANNPLQNSLEVGETSTDFGDSYLGGVDGVGTIRTYDGNIEGWDDDVSGNGAIALASQNNGRADEDLVLKLSMGECHPTFIVDVEGGLEHYRKYGPTCSEEGAVGYSYEFDGSNDYAQYENTYATGDMITGTTDVTVGIWVKPDSNTPNFDKIWTTDNGDFGIMDGGFGQLTIKHQDFTPTYTNTPITWVADEWTHLGFTWSRSSGEVKVYIDGALVNTASVTNDLIWPLGSSFLGIDTTSCVFCDYWDGHIDELYVFERVLNNTEMYDLAYNTYSSQEKKFVSSYGSIEGVEEIGDVSSLISIYGQYSLPGSEEKGGGSFIPEAYSQDLIHYYTFSEGTGTSVEDEAGNLDLSMWSGSNIDLEEIPEWTDGKYGSALDFSGETADTIRAFQSSPDWTGSDNNQITAGAWVYNKPDSLPMSQKTFVTVGTPWGEGDPWDPCEGVFFMGADGNDYVWGISTQDGTNPFQGARSTEHITWNPNSMLNNVWGLDENYGDWIYMSFTFDNGQFRGYINGDLQIAATTDYNYMNDSDYNTCGSGNDDRIHVGGTRQVPDVEGDVIVDDFAIWNTPMSEAEMGAFFDNHASQRIFTANIDKIQVYGSDTNDYDDAVLVKTFVEGVDYEISPDNGIQTISISFNTLYYNYWFWSTNFSSNTGFHTPVIHSFSLLLEQFRLPYTLVPSPLSQPTLIYEKEYGTVSEDSDHEYYLDPSGGFGRSYLRFRCPIWPHEDLDLDSTPDSGYVWIFESGKDNSVNSSHEIFISDAYRGLDHYNTFVHLYDPDLGWFNDTLPASLGMDWVFTEGMNAGIRGYELENTDREKIEFWYDHGSTMTASEGGNTGPYSTITLDGDAAGPDEDWDVGLERITKDNTDDSKPDNMDIYFSWNETSLFFGNDIDTDGEFAMDSNAMMIHIDYNPGSTIGDTTTHYDVGWNIDNSIYRYDFIILFGRISGMGDGIKFCDADTINSCQWTNNMQNYDGWNQYFSYGGGGLNEISVPRDLDGNGVVDITTDNLDDIIITFSAVNTASNYVWDSYPDTNPSGSTTFTTAIKCFEVNADVNNVFDECVEGPDFPSAPSPEVTFIFPFQSFTNSSLYPAFASPAVSVVTYDLNYTYIGDTNCQSSLGFSVDYIICSGENSENGWANQAVFEGARYVQFFVEFHSYISDGSDISKIKIFAVDKNSEFSQRKPELYNVFYEMDSGLTGQSIWENPAAITHSDRDIQYGFSPVYDMVVGDESWCFQDYQNACGIAQTWNNDPTGTYDDTDYEFTQKELFTQESEVNIKDQSFIDAGLNYAVNCLSVYVNPSAEQLNNCIRSASGFAGKTFDTINQALSPIIESAASLTNQLLGTYEPKHLLWLGAAILFPYATLALWTIDYAVGFKISDQIEILVPIIQDQVAQLAELAGQLIFYIVFLMAMGIIIGSTSLLNNALHGEWEIINQKCATSLQGSAGWLSVIPYVGGSLSSVGTKAIGGLRK